jgi:antitoxin (DNA-binding transcriptional repressor) of toxin-antitoxin stability system
MMPGTGITSTEAARGFSELLNGIRYRGERYIILRGGKPVATMGPVEGAAVARTLGEIPGLLRNLPRIDPEDTAFGADVAEACRIQPPLPATAPWD